MAEPSASRAAPRRRVAGTTTAWSSSAPASAASWRAAAGRRGLQVTLLEAAAEPGGKMRQVSVDGVRVDAGPTVFTMRWVFDEILAEAGRSLDALVALQPLSILARHAWRRAPRPAQPRPARRRAGFGRCHRRFPAPPRPAATWPSAPRRSACTARSKARTSARHRPSVLAHGPRPGTGGSGHAGGPRSFRHSVAHARPPLPRPPPAPAVRALRHLLRRLALAAPATLMLIAHVEQRRLDGARRHARAAARLAELARSAGPRCASARPAAHPGRARPRLRRAARRRARAGSRCGGLQRRRAMRWRRACWATTCRTPRPPVPAANARCRPSPGPCAHAPQVCRWCATTSSSTTTTAANSTTSSARRRLPQRRHGLRLRAGPQRRRSRARRPRAPAVPGQRTGRRRPPSFRHHGDRPMRTAAWPCCSDCGLQIDRARAGGDDHAGALPPALSGHGRGAVRRGDARLDGAVRRPGRPSALPGLYLAGGSVHPGPGVPMAAHVGATGGRGADGAPRFDQPVPPGGYLWWYVDALSDDGRHALTHHRLRRQRLLALLPARAGARRRPWPRTTARSTWRCTARARTAGR